jgi:large subunit ribosomal protein L13
MLTQKTKVTKESDISRKWFIIDAEGQVLRVTGNKMKQKTYYRHTGYVGGIKSVSLEKQLEEKPEKVISDAVYGMVPKNKLGRKILTKLKVYRGAEHPHVAQQPEQMAV